MYVYIIQSVDFPLQIYIGLTYDILGRLKDHNAGRSTHTSKFKPWKMVIYLKFENEQRARDFEKYLKSGSGRAFLKKRFL